MALRIQPVAIDNGGLGVVPAWARRLRTAATFGSEIVTCGASVAVSFAWKRRLLFQNAVDFVPRQIVGVDRGRRYRQADC